MKQTCKTRLSTEPDNPMQIFDAFCGVGVWAQRDPILPYESAEILRLMDYFGVHKALVYGMLMDRGSGWPADANLQAIKAAQSSDRFVPAVFAGRHARAGSPTLDDYFDQIRRVNAGAVWLRATTGGPLRSLETWMTNPILERCQACKIPVFLHADKDPLTTTHRICNDFPSLRLVLSGVAYSYDDCLFPLLEKHENLHVCLGHYYIPSGGPMHFIERFSAKRLIFGSGMPYFSPGGLIGHIQYAPIDDDQKALILGGNLNRLLEERML